MKLILMKRLFSISERRQVLIHQFRDVESVELTVFVELLGQRVGSSLTYKKFLLEIFKLLLALFQLGAQFLVDF